MEPEIITRIGTDPEVAATVESESSEPYGVIRDMTSGTFFLVEWTEVSDE